MEKINKDLKDVIQETDWIKVKSQYVKHLFWIPSNIGFLGTTKEKPWFQTTVVATESEKEAVLHKDRQEFLEYIKKELLKD